MTWRLVVLGVALAGGLARPVAASHGRLVGGVVVEFRALRSIQSPREGEACAIAGAVHNGSAGPIMVRVVYRARDLAGRPLAAQLSLADLAAGARREFTSPPLVRPDGSVVACRAVHGLTMETAADPAR